ncbi:MAG: hypothetical protein ACPHK8_04310 [Thermoplasmatota archaeon]
MQKILALLVLMLLPSAAADTTDDSAEEQWPCPIAYFLIGSEIVILQPSCIDDWAYFVLDQVVGPSS